MVDRLASICGVQRSSVRRNQRHDAEPFSDVWVNFATAGAADAAIRALDGTPFGGKELKASLARMQGEGKKEQQVEMSSVAGIAYGVGGVYSLQGGG